ncbi:MAG: pantoate--beta-alanine ligase [Phycisphaerales bacterium]|nr:pantoate--beta-alanine ligase [Phycisphaerales bacterium]
MDTLHGLDDLHAWRGGTFVPTMGALHKGHCDLIRLGRACDGPLIVSIFVNPRQFAPSEDLATYPRTLDADLQAAADAGADAVFLPTESDIYPTGHAIDCPPLPAVARAPRLEDGSRPHFFTGVCTVVARLFDLLSPKRAIFGEKDWQQLQVIKAMVEADPDRFPIEILPCPTRREPDGLAMSSRNVHLSPAHRHRALALHRSLELARSATDSAAAEALMRGHLEASDLAIDYAVVRNATTLEASEQPLPPLRALIAARLGDVRLIDNAAL